MSITLKELIKDKDFDSLEPEIQRNLQDLLVRINIIREEWGKPMTVTSGLRTKEDQLRVYREKAQKAGQKFDEKKVPMGSQHLKGAAVDISDPKLELTAWLKANPEILKEADLYCEEGNKNWVHAQIFPPKSGKRWFLP